jgi:hypothetical protein
VDDRQASTPLAQPQTRFSDHTISISCDHNSKPTPSRDTQFTDQVRNITFFGLGACRSTQRYTASKNLAREGTHVRISKALLQPTSFGTDQLRNLPRREQVESSPTCRVGPTASSVGCALKRLELTR